MRLQKYYSLELLKTGIKELSPGYFALVMATGIVSLASANVGLVTIGWILYFFNILAFVVLLFLSVTRLLLYKDVFFSDFRNEADSPGFLTLVAGINILGYQVIYFQGYYRVGGVLFVIALLFWVVLIYSIFTNLIVGKTKRPLVETINGMWLLIVVSTASICVLGVSLAYNQILNKEIMLFGILCLFLIAGMFYFIINTLIFYRLAFFTIKPEQLAPTYWINMGASAILTLAGASIGSLAESWTFLEGVKSFVIGFTLLFWAFSTWWIPLLLILGFWKNIIEGLSIQYQAQYWGLVFPLGMYTMCTLKLSEVTGIVFLSSIPKFFIYIALFSWVATFCGWFLKICGFKIFFSEGK